MPLTSPRFAGNARLQSAAENRPPLKIGEPKGQAVELLQQALADLGYQMPISFRDRQAGRDLRQGDDRSSASSRSTRGSPPTAGTGGRAGTP